MANPEWGKKQTCPKCGERFYDLGNDDPVTCIACANEWVPEPILKTKQPIVAVPEPEKKKAEDESEDDLTDDSIDLDDDDDDVDSISLDDDDDDEVAAIVDTSLSDDDT